MTKSYPAAILVACPWKLIPVTALRKDLSFVSPEPS